MREGGSIVRIDSRRRFRLAGPSTSIASSPPRPGEAASATEIASATSATPSSSLAGSNMMLLPTAMTSNVMGGRERATPLLWG